MVRAYDANHEVARALASLKGAKKGLRASDWTQLGESYDEFSQAAFTIGQLGIAEIAQFEEQLTNSVKYAAKLCDRIEGMGATSDGLDAVKTNASIRSHEQLMTSIAISLQGKALQ